MKETPQIFQQRRVADVCHSLFKCVTARFIRLFQNVSESDVCLFHLGVKKKEKAEQKGRNVDPKTKLKDRA